ncbi:MAG TPA: hypothetical protein VEY12_06880, partial [Thermoplasmata archaeon]|nr:hypothetical protein [Thermoplasmata archaeon]
GVPDTNREHLGAKVRTRHETAEVSDSGADVHLVFTVWDIAGRRFYNKRQLRAYCRGAKTILAACDLSETRSVEELGYWLSVATRILGKVTVVILARDRPAADPLPIAEARLAETARTFGAIVLHVPRGDRRRMEHLFHGLGAETVRDVFGLPWRPGMFA